MSLTAMNMSLGGAWPVSCNSGAPSFTSFGLDDPNKGIAIVFQAQDSGDITHLGFRYGLRTGTPPSYQVSLRSVDASGLPGGTTHGSATFTPPASAAWDGTWQWAALSSAVTPTLGAYYALVIDGGAAADASNFSSFATNCPSTLLPSVSRLPYYLTKSGGTWTKATSSYFPLFGVRSATVRYGGILESFYTSLSSTTVGDRIAMAFELPVGLGGTFQILGARFFGKLSSHTTSEKSPALGVWDGTTVKQSVTLGSLVTSSPNGTGVHTVYFDSPLANLSAGVKYRVGLEIASGADANVQIFGFKVANSDDLAAYPGGNAYHLSTFNGSVWTDDQTVRPLMELILADAKMRYVGGQFNTGIN